MAIPCGEVRELLASPGGSAPLSDERAEQVAEHLDQCAECDRQLSRTLGDAMDALPVAGKPSLSEVRRLARKRQSFVLQSAAAAAALFALLGTGWALLRDRPVPTPARPVVVVTPPVELPIPDPPKLADFSEADRRLIESEGVLTLYMQFCLTCIN